MTVLNVRVPGAPVPQGSMKSFGPGRMAHSNAATLLPWRHAVMAYVREQMQRGGEWPITGPVQVDVTFFLARPKSAPNRMWPEKKPDVDKLVRGALDCLSVKTGAGAIGDDAQVVIVRASKQYGVPGMDLRLRSLEQPRRAARPVEGGINWSGPAPQGGYGAL